MRKHILYLLSAVILAGCTREAALTEVHDEEEDATPIFTADESELLAERGMPAKFGQQEIDRIVDDAAVFLDEVSPSTRSVKRTASKITPISGFLGTATRSGGGTNEDGDEEKLFYAVDFGNGEGYALISADRRMPNEILINVGNGSFPEGEVENPGLALMLAGAESYARREIARRMAWQDSVEVAMLTRLTGENPELAESVTEYLASVGSGGSQIETRTEDSYYIHERREYGPWQVLDDITPMTPVEWGQHYPFNATVEKYEGNEVPAGCVAIALVQLMTYWQYPTSFCGTTIDWDELGKWTGSRWYLTGRYKTWYGAMYDAPQQTQNMCANLIWHIGLGVGMNYGIGGSGASSSSAIDLLQTTGYNAPSRRNYKKEPVVESIRNSRPVYIHGATKQILGIFPGDGHAWLIDGYRDRYRQIVITRTVSSDSPLPVMITRALGVGAYSYTYTVYDGERQEHFHNNFGWDGRDNGYYNPGIFETSLGNYKHNLRIWTNIHP